MGICYSKRRRSMDQSRSSDSFTQPPFMITDRDRKNSLNTIFERARSQSVVCLPPASQSRSADKLPKGRYFEDIESRLTAPLITEENVLNALTSEVKKHKSWRMEAVKRMNILNINTSLVLRYSLQSFIEVRKTYDVSESYTGDVMPDDDTNFRGSVENLDPWQFTCEPLNLFHEDEKLIELPGSSYVSTCSTCRGQGSSHCFHCRGGGTDRCGVCNGTGMKSGVPHPAVVTHPLVGGSRGSAGNPQSPRRGLGAGALVGGVGGPATPYARGTPLHFASMAGLPPPGVSPADLCLMCHGSGLKQCHYCRGSGKKLCGLCGGSGRMRSFTKMRIKRRTESSEYLHECPIPAFAMATVSGDIIFIEILPQVQALDTFPVAAINQQSYRLIQAHRGSVVGYAKIIHQRHMIESVPITQVSYSLRGRKGVFWVLGNELAAYVPRYPQKCSIL